MNIGERIKQLRNRNGLTQDELATKTGMSKNGIWNYENEKRCPDIKTLTKIAEALNVNLFTLLESCYDYIAVDSVNHTEDYKEYIDTFKKLGYEIFEHTTSCSSDSFDDTYIYDILLNKKVIITLHSEDFYSLSEKIFQYKQTFDKSLSLLINDTISNWESQNKKAKKDNR